ncbi:hypothetical protein L596_009953 [Steinernema carpocapsae]|uniref:Uncharacterized protein n=1 Tax=Steinernema carpocapsae TaxID=34508 RepID=A0A4U5PH28_STECR|nr:hypothetical protein L596_009953 [Steinernema carpocapsae]
MLKLALSIFCFSTLIYFSWCYCIYQIRQDVACLVVVFGLHYYVLAIVSWKNLALKLSVGAFALFHVILAVNLLVTALGWQSFKSFFVPLFIEGVDGKELWHISFILCSALVFWSIGVFFLTYYGYLYKQEEQQVKHSGYNPETDLSLSESTKIKVKILFGITITLHTMAIYGLLLNKDSFCLPGISAIIFFVFHCVPLILSLYFKFHCYPLLIWGSYIRLNTLAIAMTIPYYLNFFYKVYLRDFKEISLTTFLILTGLVIFYVYATAMFSKFYDNIEHEEKLEWAKEGSASREKEERPSQPEKVVTTMMN